MSEPIIIDGLVISHQVLESLQPRIQKLKSKGILPGLAVVLVGDDPSSQSYVRMKAKTFAIWNLFSETFYLPGDSDLDSVLKIVRDLNSRPEYHGILVQLPLPSHLDEMQVIQAIDPQKDADGLHPLNLGKLMLGVEGPMPCTPHGILMLLKYSNINPKGKQVVIIGRSNIVGKPVANLLMQKCDLGDATVTVCHSRTQNLAAIARQADILIAALGRPEFIDRTFIKEGAVVIDVGINRVEDSTTPKGYRLVGDVNFDDVRDLVSAITPVPGGVGPMTRAMLVANTIYLAENSA
jgi:methylenetetrahydrofolate dehydrogenase (NADP+)/methenyltetrahydrofolate cyclohydrolase